MSPKAKGRIERLWGTFHDRLTAEMRLAGIRKIEEANQFIPQFLVAQRVCKVIMDVQPSVELGVHGPCRAGLGRTIQLRVLQPDADLDADWIDHDGAVPPADVVYLLSDGIHIGIHIVDEKKKKT